MTSYLSSPVGSKLRGFLRAEDKSEENLLHLVKTSRLTLLTRCSRLDDVGQGLDERGQILLAIDDPVYPSSIFSAMSAPGTWLKAFIIDQRIATNPAKLNAEIAISRRVSFATCGLALRFFSLSRSS